MGLARQAGLDASLSFTLYDEPAEDIERLLDSFLQTESGSMLFLSVAKDPMNPVPFDDTRWQQISGILRRAHDPQLFAFIPASEKGKATVWYSYFIPLRKENGGQQIYPYKGTVADRIPIRMGHFLKGQYTHRMPKSEGVIKFRVLSYGLFRFRPGPALHLIRTKEESTLHHKMIVYDGGPCIGPSGTTVRCSFCPTAILQNDRLVPCCDLQAGDSP
jgi:hypothetical protein